VVPDYTTTDTTYYQSLSDALATYRNGVIASTATRLQKTMQLAGIQKFTATSNALVTTRLQRSAQNGTNPLDCVKNDGFAEKLEGGN
jgi:hypothetical protein